MANDVKLLDVLNSKVYVHEKSQITFGSPKSFIEPFLDKFSNLGVEFKVGVSERVVNKEADNDNINQAFGRVLIEAKFPQQYCTNEHDTVIGMMYALDIQKPVVKIYSGHNAWACTNLAIFGGRYVHQVEILSGYQSVYDKGLEYVDGLTKQLAEFQHIYSRMNETIYEGEDINKIIGKLVREGYKNKQIGVTPILSAIKDLEDSKSKYAIAGNQTSQWNIYSAITNYITDKVDILDKASKTALISNLFVQQV
jgi:hypothetical protein